MSVYTEFFLSSSPAVVELEMIELSHPNFPTTYRLIRNYYPSLEVTHPEGVQWIFDGVDDQISFGDILDKERTTAFSLAGWATATTSGVVFAKQSGVSTQGWRFRVGTVFDFIIHNAATGSVYVTSPIDGVPGTLQHYVVTYDGTATAAGTKLYLNGVDVGTLIINDDDLTSGSTLNSEPLVIGVRGSTLPIGGVVQHCSIWNKALSPSEVLQVYGGGVPPNLLATTIAANLELWVKLDENDAVGSGNINNYAIGGTDGTAGGGLTPTTGGAPFTYTFCPMAFKPLGSQVDLDQEIEVTIGDVGQILPAAIASVMSSASGFFVKPTAVYRTYRSDDLTTPLFGPVRLRVDGVAFSRQGCSFRAKAAAFNVTRTGETYRIERFPMLRPLA